MENDRSCGLLLSTPKRLLSRPQREIFGHGELVYDVQLLINGANAGVHGLSHVSARVRPSIQRDRALRHPFHAGEDLDQRGFSRAVLPDQAMHRVAPHGEIHALERHHAGISLYDSPHFQNIIVAVHCILHSTAPREATLPLASFRNAAGLTGPARPRCRSRFPTLPA